MSRASPQPPPSSPSTPERIAAAELFDSGEQPLSERIAALRAKLPELVQEAKRGRWPADVSPAVAWALKRLERWSADDPRPVRVLVLGGKRCLAAIDDQPDVLDGRIEGLAVQGRG